MHIRITLVFLIFILSQSSLLLLGGPQVLPRERLESYEIQEIVKSALKASSPCSNLVEIINGTQQVVSGVKYQFRIRTIPKKLCSEAYHGNTQSDLTIFLPADRSARPVYSLE